MKNKFWIFGLSFLILVSGFYISSAADGVPYSLLQPLPGVGQQVSTFSEYIKNIIPFILSLAAVLAVVMIVIGGIQYAISEAIDSKADARDRITQAIFGLLLALLSYLILWTINPQLVNLQLDIKSLNQNTTTTQPQQQTTQQPQQNIIIPGSEGIENVM